MFFDIRLISVLAEHNFQVFCSGWSSSALCFCSAHPTPWWKIPRFLPDKKTSPRSPFSTNTEYQSKTTGGNLWAILVRTDTRRQRKETVPRCRGAAVLQQSSLLPSREHSKVNTNVEQALRRNGLSCRIASLKGLLMGFRDCHLQATVRLKFLLAESFHQMTTCWWSAWKKSVSLYLSLKVSVLIHTNSVTVPGLCFGLAYTAILVFHAYLVKLKKKKNGMGRTLFEAVPFNFAQ